MTIISILKEQNKVATAKKICGELKTVQVHRFLSKADFSAEYGNIDKWTEYKKAIRDLRGAVDILRKTDEEKDPKIYQEARGTIKDNLLHVVKDILGANKPFKKQYYKYFFIGLERVSGFQMCILSERAIQCKIENIAYMLLNGIIPQFKPLESDAKADKKTEAKPPKNTPEPPKLTTSDKKPNTTKKTKKAAK